MYIHKEGFKMLFWFGLLVGGLITLTWLRWPAGGWFVTVALGIFYLLLLQFFRNPKRSIPEKGDRLIYAPADGKVVVIEETTETEYFQEPRLQISIFMSPTNVHVNRNPVNGEVKYVKHHPGKYLVAWHPKSSTENERTTVVLENENMTLLIRQIAGAMAKRIVNYLAPGQTVKQGSEMGFIKFGSRVDVFLPLDAKVEVEIGQKVKGNKTVLAHVVED